MTDPKALAAKLRGLITFSNVTPAGFDHYHITEAAGECKGGDVIMEVIAALEASDDKAEVLKARLQELPTYSMGVGKLVRLESVLKLIAEEEQKKK